MAKRVLIADDEPAILALCSRAVRSWGYEVAKASSGEEALALVKREHFDVLIADIVMPGMSGIELLQKAREVIPELAVVVITGFSSVESAIKALRAGAHDFITKPFHIEELREAIEHALQEVRAAEEHAQLRALWPLWELGQRALRQSDEGKLSAEMLDIALSASEAEGAALLLKVEEAETLTIGAQTGKVPEPLPDLSEALEQWKEQPQALNPFEEGDENLEALSVIEEGRALCVPLVGSMGLVGALLLYYEEEALPLRRGDRRMAVILANQMAIILENVRLVRQLKEWSRELEKRVEERTRELREAHERLIRAERLATVGKFGAGIAHELRNPLGVISNSVYYLKNRLGDADPKVVKHLNIISREVERANNIITDLMNFVRVSELRTELTDPNELVRTTLERALIPEGVTVRTELTEGLPKIDVDSEKLEQVFLNLINNAVQAMPDGGELCIRTGAENGEVSFDFKDTGEGIPPENMDKIFEPLFTTKTRGIGLGLALAKLLVDAHEGEIDVASQVGEGTCFTVRLPHQSKGE